MFDATNLSQNVSDFEKAPQFDGFTRVVIEVSDDVEYSAGTKTGRTLTLFSPWATQQTALDILAKIKNFQYQPYRANGAFIDPAAELGDGITIDGLYSGIYAEDINFGPLFAAAVAAPFEEEINHEYQFVPEKERRVQRSLKNLSSSLTVQAGKIEAEVKERKASDEEINSRLSVQSGQIEAKVEKHSGDSSTFGWIMDEKELRIYANGNSVLKAAQGGLEVTGRVTATSGKIGGFDIVEDHLSYNGATWGGSNNIGAYLGIDGLQLGSWENGFHVDNRGNLYAENGHFRGTIDAGSIDYGGSAGYFDGNGLESDTVSGGYGGAIMGGTIDTSNTDWGINSSLGSADFAQAVFDGYDSAGYVSATYGYFNFIVMGGNIYEPKKTTIAGRTIYYLGLSSYD